MRGKVIYRIAAGTCSVCIAYGLVMQALRGESSTQVTGALAVSSVVVAEAQPSVSPQMEEPSESTQDAGGSSNGNGSSNYPAAGFYGGGKHGKRRHGEREEDTARNAGEKGQSEGNAAAASGEAAGSSEGTFATEEEEKDRTEITGGQEMKESASITEAPASGDPPTLEQFLSLLRCGGCRHNCSLLSPRCMKGRSKAQEATVEYQTTYGG